MSVFLETAACTATGQGDAGSKMYTEKITKRSKAGFTVRIKEYNFIIAIILKGTAFLLQGLTDDQVNQLTFKFKIKDSVQYDISEFTQQDGMTKVTGLLLVCFVVIFT